MKLSKKTKYGLGYCALLGMSIPWYWPSNVLRPFILGLPVWTIVSLLFTLMLAIYTAWGVNEFWPSDSTD
ncbi:MAG: hypothetical protein ACI9CF_000950 [Candidatus Omnitrophota bacterium]|jgi:hypothetical protein